VSAARPSWGLIGASSFASLVMIDAFRAVDDGRVASVFSASAERGRRFAEANGVPRVDETLEALLGDPDIDAVYVSTTNDLHADQVVAAAAAGKHVLCEKPLATTLDDALRMRDACRDARVVLAVNHHMRCQDTVRAMRRLLDDGAVGDVLAARSAHTGSLAPFLRTWRINRPEAGAGVVLDLTVHDADTLRYLLDDDIRAVTAMTVTQGVAEGAIEDAVVGAMRTSRGTPVSFHDAFTIPHAGTALEVHGTAGSLIGRNVYGPEPAGEVIVRREDREESLILGDRRNPYERGVEAFLAAARGDGNPAATAEDGIASLAVALATLESARSGRTVEVSAVDPPGRG
jgi:1,5-anhydro-D-fructose reductase (1,5-anhydro-D-mannitol-forming)